jgi:hypothetical protein
VLFVFAAVSAVAVRAQQRLFELAVDPGTSSFALQSAAVGDPDGDGFADFAIGLPAANGSDGRVVVRSGRDGRVLAAIAGDPSTRSVFGAAIAPAGDVDGDGHGDFAVGMSRHAGNGGVRVFSGRTFARLREHHGDGSGDLFGASLALAGDVDGDGVLDYLAGAPENGDPIPNYGPGYARLYSGATGAVLHTFRGVAIGDEFGAAVAGVGDVDLDGCADVMVGALLEATPANAQGSARVFSGRTGAVLFTFRAEPWTDHFGMSVASAGDMDGDGRGDLLVGSINPFTFITGAVWVYSGRDGAVLRVVRGGPRSGMFGRHVRGVGDVDFDGHADFLVADPGDAASGAPLGSVQLFSGRTFAPLSSWSGASGGEGFGDWLDVVGDLTGDGLPEFAVAAPGAVRGPATGVVTLFSTSGLAEVGRGCTLVGMAPRFTATEPRRGAPWTLFVVGKPTAAVGALLVSPAPLAPSPFGDCALWLDPGRAVAAASFVTDRSGRWAGTVAIPADPRLASLQFAGQGVLHAPTVGLDWTNGVLCVVR